MYKYELSTSYVKAFEGYRLTEPKLYTTPLHDGHKIGKHKIGKAVMKPVKSLRLVSWKVFV